MLVGPPGVLSWVPYNEVVDENNVYAGIVDNTSVYLCRTKFGQDQLLIGVLNPIRKVCIVAQGKLILLLFKTAKLSITQFFCSL